MHVNHAHCRLSVLLEAFPKRVKDAGNNFIYAGLLHRHSCVLRIIGYILETAVLADFLHISKNAENVIEIIHRIYLGNFLSHLF